MANALNEPRATEPPSELTPVMEAEKLNGKGPHALSVAGVDLVFIRTASGPKLFQGRCPHQGALLGEGELDGGTLVCRNHRWRFATADGRRVGGPECLTECPVTERGGKLFADLSPLKARQEGGSGIHGAKALRRIEDLPGPKGLPVIGNAWQLELTEMHRILEGWAEKYGLLYTIRLGRTPIIVLSDAELSMQVLRARPETYRRLGTVEPVFEELGLSGVFSAEGTAWRPQRRLAMEALSNRHLRGFYPTLLTVAERLRRRWQAAVARSAEIDIVEDLKRFTVDVTSGLTFGQDFNTIEQSGDDVVQRRLEHLFPAFNRRIFATFPLWRYLRLPADYKLDRALAELRIWSDGLVKDARARSAAEPTRLENPSNFLDAMLAARDDNGEPFSDSAIFGNLMTMLVAGEDTTAYTLAWAVHHLCEKPDSVALLRAEADNLFGNSFVAPDIETANRLVYAGAVANEAMRVRPVAPLIGLESAVDTVLGDLALPARTPVFLLTRPPTKTDAHFHAAERFLPERWLDAEPRTGSHDPSVHIPFGSGPRTCPGRTLALLEMKVVLSTLYKSFEVSRRGDPAGVREAFAFTMSPVGLKVNLLPRNGSA